MKIPMSAAMLFLGVTSLAATSQAYAENRTRTGEVTLEPPTLIALGVEWEIQGDDNRSAHVTVEYRKQGSARWSRGLDPLRLQNEEVYTRGALDYTAPNMFTGSLFDLEPDTSYDVKLTLTDPDGVDGDAEKTITARTRDSKVDFRAIATPPNMTLLPFKFRAISINVSAYPRVSPLAFTTRSSHASSRNFPIRTSPSQQRGLNQYTAQANLAIACVCTFVGGTTKDLTRAIFLWRKCSLCFSRPSPWRFSSRAPTHATNTSGSCGPLTNCLTTRFSYLA